MSWACRHAYALKDLSLAFGKSRVELQVDGIAVKAFLKLAWVDARAAIITPRT